MILVMATANFIYITTSRVMMRWKSKQIDGGNDMTNDAAVDDG